MSLISKQEILKTTGLGKLGFLGGFLVNILMKITKINQINILYEKLKHLKGADFFNHFIKERGIQYIVFEEDLAKIPKNGAFILVANHPLGAVDGILMCKIMSEIRPDFKVMGNFLLEKIEPMKPYILSVNPFGSDRKNLHSSTQGMRETLKHLQQGGCVGIFPAGEVSNKNNPQNEIRDKEWESVVLKLIKKAKVPVVPMYFHAKNSSLFYTAAKIHPDLQTALLPTEMMRKRKSPIKIRIGKPVSAKIIDEQDSLKEIGEYLENKIYLLKSYYKKNKDRAEILKLPNLKLNFSVNKTANVIQNIIDETPVEDILKEIEKLRQEDKLFFSNGNYEVFFAQYDSIPFVMREIGRLRELTFRKVGEGSNLPFDLDEYDKDYHHLFLWDNQAQKIVGAYRMGLGREIIKKRGVEGFYTASLFDFDQELHPFFGKIIEMGRAFITIDYQLKPLPLFLLWRGIVHVCLRNPDHKFLMGGVSISSKFSDFSKSLMIEFMRSNYYDAAVAQYIHPKHEFKVVMKQRDRDQILNEVNSDLNKLDKMIDDLEPEMRMPVLFKKYIKQNAKVVSFNVDPNFNDAIDGLMYIRISELPEETIKPVLEEISDQLRKEDKK